MQLEDVTLKKGNVKHRLKHVTCNVQVQLKMVTWKGNLTSNFTWLAFIGKLIM